MTTLATWILPILVSPLGAGGAGAQPVDLPADPRPYRIEEVRFIGGADDVRLAGTLTLPEGQRPFPAVALLSVSGPADRDQSLGGGHKPFKVLADYLTTRGMAVLRTDDRGVGGSTGSWTDAGLAERIADARAAMTFLAADPRVDSERIGLIGNSEGAVVAAGAAVEDDRAALVVMLGAPGVPGFDIIRKRALAMQRARGGGAAGLEVVEGRLERLRDLVVSDLPESDLRRELRAMLAEGPLLPPYRFVPQDVDGRLDLLTSPWYRTQLTIDPEPIYTALDGPVLALTGSLDRTNPPTQNLVPLLQALERGGNADHSAARLPGLNHYMQPAEIGGPAEAPTLERSFSSLALQTIGDWIAARFEIAGNADAPSAGQPVASIRPTGSDPVGEIQLKR